MFLRITLSERDTFLDLLKQVTLQYLSAYEHADSGMIAVQSPQPEYVWNPRFNWIPGQFNMSPEGDPHDGRLNQALRIHQSRFDLSPRDDF